MINKRQFFYLNETTEDQIFDKIIEGLPADNREFYIKHTAGSPVFKVKTEPKWLNKEETIFEKLKPDVNSVLFTKEKINSNLFKRLKKSLYAEDKKLLNLILAVENFNELNKKDSKTLPIRLDYVEKRNIDRSTLYSVHGPFQLFHVDIANLRLLGKS